MSQQRILPARLQMPSIPKDSPSWVGSFTRFVNDILYRMLSDRIEAIITQDVLANRPAADGSRRFFFATDTLKLYYDSGVWTLV